MQYVWEAFQNGRRLDVGLGPVEDASPYAEMTDGNVFPESVSYNPFFRYGKTMEYLWYVAKNKDDFQTLFEACSRVLIETDLSHRLSVEWCEKQDLSDRIMRGQFGDEISKGFQLLSESERDRLVHSIWMSTRSNQKYYYSFAQAVLTNLHAAGVYQDRDNPRKIVVYVGHKKREKEGRILQLLSFFLLPMDNTYEVLWEQPFSILGVTELMKMDELVMMRE